MYGVATIKKINKSYESAEPVKVLSSVGVGSISEIPLVSQAPEGFRAVGEPVKATLDGGDFVESLNLAGTRQWIREVGAKFVGFTKQGATVGILQAFEPV